LGPAVPPPFVRWQPWRDMNASPRGAYLRCGRIRARRTETAEGGFLLLTCHDGGARIAALPRMSVRASPHINTACTREYLQRSRGRSCGGRGGNARADASSSRTRARRERELVENASSSKTRARRGGG